MLADSKPSNVLLVHRIGRQQPEKCPVSPSCWPTATRSVQKRSVLLVHRVGRQQSENCPISPSCWPTATRSAQKRAVLVVIVLADSNPRCTEMKCTVSHRVGRRQNFKCPVNPSCRPTATRSVQKRNVLLVYRVGRQQTFKCPVSPSCWPTANREMSC